MRSIHVSSLVAAATLVVAGCRHTDNRAKDSVDASISFSRSAGAGARTATLGPGDIRIESESNGVDLALIGDTISSGLSSKALDKANRETDTAKVSGNGLGASIEKMVKGTVQTALATRVAFPISAVRDVRVDGGKLIFDWNGSPKTIFTQTKVNGKPMLESFRPEDAQRFVDAVRARKGQLER